MPGDAIDAREYKLLLKARAFSDPQTVPTAAQFWRKVVMPIVKSTRGFPRTAKALDLSTFSQEKRRSIRFWDTAAGTLTKQSLSLRTRIDATAEGEETATAEVSLKLRTPDLFVAAAHALPGTGRGVKTKLEEDVAPLSIRGAAGGRRAHTCLAEPRTVRTRFSRSTRMNERAPSSIGQVYKLYPTLKGYLQFGNARPPASAVKLIGGPEIHELVFDGAGVALGDGFAAEFTMTLWYFKAIDCSPDVAEISYKCKTPDGHMSLGAARRAHELFIALQYKLGDLLDAEAISKTALALPRGGAD